MSAQHQTACKRLNTYPHVLVQLPISNSDRCVRPHAANRAVYAVACRLADGYQCFLSLVSVKVGPEFTNDGARTSLSLSMNPIIAARPSTVLARWMASRNGTWLDDPEAVLSVL